MSKGLEKIKIIRHIHDMECGKDESINKDFDIIEKELIDGEKNKKALEIIKKHIVNRDLDTSGIYLEYRLGLFEPYYSIEIKRGTNQIVTEKEYNLLREVLLCLNN